MAVGGYFKITADCDQCEEQRTFRGPTAARCLEVLKEEGWKVSGWGLKAVALCPQCNKPGSGT
jgi:Fe2+ or Zn2+ uptake regulation protein